MRWNIAGKDIPETLLYGREINRAAHMADCPPALLYAVCYHETIVLEVAGKINAATFVADDNGHGLAQLTSWWPNPGWDQPLTNAFYAAKDWLMEDAPKWFRLCGFTGETLVRCVAASYNAGFGNAWKGHLNGNVDEYDTDNYGAAVLKIYQSLVNTGKPE